MAKILIIDDDEMLRVVLARALRAGGHETMEAGDGARGVRLVKEWSPDLVISDIRMPDQDGIQTIGELRDFDPAMPIIVMSGEKQVGNYDPLLDAGLLGADIALAKPFTMPTLLDAVKQLLDNRKER